MFQMFNIDPASYNGKPPWQSYYIDITDRLTIEIGRGTWGFDWIPPKIRFIYRDADDE